MVLAAYKGSVLYLLTGSLADEDIPSCFQTVALVLAASPGLEGSPRDREEERPRD